METKRQANFELLRIVAMLMILVLHYLSRGQIIADGDMDQWTAVECAAYLIRAFCIVPVNCYVLVSGYFLVQSPWKPGRIVTIAGQLLFYSLLVPAVLLCIGAVPFGSLTVYDWLNYLLPVETEHYWFGTAYLLMYVFAPFLAAGVRAVQKRTLQIALGVLGLYFCVWESVLPVHLATDRTVGWNVVVKSSPNRSPFGEPSAVCIVPLNPRKVNPCLHQNLRRRKQRNRKAV